MIDSSGISFSKDKIREIVEFRKPTTQKEMKSFLGFANYFSDHIMNHAMIVRPLHALTHEYKPKSKLVWNDEANSAFDAIKMAINECPKLFFVDTTSPVYLNTDASDYGVGGVLYQVKEGKVHIIAITSKSLTPVQRRWSTADKEAYAIV